MTEKTIRTVKEILAQHQKWLRGEAEGVQLCWLSLLDEERGALRSADLSSANLRSADLSSADLSYTDLSYTDLSSADLSSANLSYTDLSYTDLSSADLSYTDLRSADLSSADLRSADLRSANLRSANLSSADLSYTKGVSKYLTTSLYWLQDQVGKIRAYKLVTDKFVGPWNGGLEYQIGSTVTVDNPCEDEQQPCAAGINLATLDWCMKEWRPGYHILVCEFATKDIAAIPIGSGGKFRVKQCKVIKEKDLMELGLIEKESKS